MRILAATLLLTPLSAFAAPPAPSRAAPLQVVHCCRVGMPPVVVIRNPAPPMMLPPPPVMMAPPHTTDPAILVLLHQILANQTTIISNQSKLLAAPPPCNGNGTPGIIVIPADGSGVVTPIPTLPGIVPAPGGTPNLGPAPGGAPGISAPPGGPPVLGPAPGGSPGLGPVPGGSPKIGTPSMPPADALGMQRFSYIRYTVYRPSDRRYFYVYIPQGQQRGTPAATKIQHSVFTPSQPKR